jgi:F0F1-type ATP synthase delta subunit
MAYKLPSSIYTTSQLRQLQRELQQLTTLRSAKNVSLSNLMQDFAIANGIKKFDTVVAKKLLSYVDLAITSAPEISISLASMPNDEERGELVRWLRNAFGPQLMLHIIVQPTILAGCVLRTNKQVYDWSLQHALEANVDKLTQKVAHV